MKKISKQTIEIQEYNDQGGRAIITTSNSDTDIIHEIRTRDPKKFKQMKTAIDNISSRNDNLFKNSLPDNSLPDNSLPDNEDKPK